MKAAPNRLVKYYNQKVATKELKLKVGDWVIVNTKNIKTKRSSKRLEYKLKSKFENEKLCEIKTYRLK